MYRKLILRNPTLIQIFTFPRPLIHSIIAFIISLNAYALSQEYVIIRQDPCIYLFKAEITNSKPKMFQGRRMQSKLSKFGNPYDLTGMNEFRYHRLNKRTKCNKLLYVLHCIFIGIRISLWCNALLELHSEQSMYILLYRPK